MHVTKIYLNELVFWQSFDNVWIKDQYIYSASKRCFRFCILIISLLVSHVVDLRNRIFNSIKSASSSVPPCGPSKSSNLSFLLKRYGPSRMMHDKDCGQNMRHGCLNFAICSMLIFNASIFRIIHGSWTSLAKNIWFSTTSSYQLRN